MLTFPSSKLTKMAGKDKQNYIFHKVNPVKYSVQMHKNPLKARFIIAPPKSSIKPLARTITSVFRLFFRQIQTFDAKCGFFTGVNTFWVVQNNKQ